MFYAQSGLCYEKMNLLDKILMSFRCKYVKKTFGENSVEYKGISNYFDASSKETLIPIIAYLKKLSS